MGEAAKLPSEFSELQAFCARWNLNTFTDRFNQRRRVSLAEMKKFYDEMMPVASKALLFLDTAERPLGEREQALENLLLSLAHVSLAVEKMGDYEETHASMSSKISITEKIESNDRA